MRPRLNSQGGFSLLEAVVALSVAGMLTVAVLGTFRETLAASQRADAAGERLALAEYCLSRLRIAPAAALAHLPDSLREQHLPPPYAMATCRASAAPVRSNRDLYDLRVELTWDGGRSVLVTRVFRPQLEEQQS